MGGVSLWLFDDPYRVIGWGLVGLGVVGLVREAGRRIRLKESYLNRLVVCLLAFLPLVSIFRSGTYQSGDLTHQAYFAAEFYNSLIDGISLPRWAENLNFGFGNPMFIFTYPLPYFLAAGFHLLGFNYINSIKAVLIFTFLLSGWGAYLWGRKHFSQTGAVILSLMYLYAPYHLINMHFRVALGEITALAVLPFGLYFLFNWINIPRLKTFIPAAVSLALLVMAHQAVALITLPFIGGYGWYLMREKSEYKFWKWALPFVVGLLLSAFYWWPVIGEMKYTHQLVYNQAVEFMPYSWSVISPWKWGFLWQGHNGETANVIGLAGGAALGIAAAMLRQKKITRNRGLLKLVLIFFTTGFFLMQEFSWPLWQFLPFVKHLQFAYRWSSLLIILVAVIGAIWWDNWKSQVKKRWLPAVLGIIILPTILNWGNRKMLPPLTDEQIRQGLAANTLFNPYSPATPRWTNPADPWQRGFAKNTLQVIEGKAETIQLERNSIRHDYYIQAENNLLLRENTYYFPGWQVLADGNKITFHPQTFQTGILHFQLPPGSHRVSVVFSDTPTRKWAKIISLTTGLVLILAMIQELKRKHW